MASIFVIFSQGRWLNAVPRQCAAAAMILTLTACGGDSGSSSRPSVVVPPVVPPPADVPAVPQGVQVVAGDSNSTEIENTISWPLDPEATDYTVYWDTVPGVTENSSQLVPATQGLRYVTHSGVEVVAGNSYYYRVQAISADGASVLSAEVSGTPQLSITGNQLNDVAWNGVNTVVAVGDSGVILSSPNGTVDGWTDVSVAGAPQTLAGVTWEGVNSQFLVVGAGSSVLSGDGTNWTIEDLGNLPGAVNLEDVAWLGDRYIAVGKSGVILTSNGDGSGWTQRDAGAEVASAALNAVASNADRIVVVGTNGTILNSVDAVTWELLPGFTNNDLNDISWDGTQFAIVGSNDTILTSADGISWDRHTPGTSDINFVGVSKWDSGLPQDPVLATVGSAGTFVIRPDGDPGIIIRTGTTEQLGGIAWVDDGVAPAYFIMVGHDGTVLSSQQL